VGEGVWVALGLPYAGHVSMGVFNLRGEKVRKHEQDLEEGIHEWHWDLRNDAGNPLAPGVYYMHTVLSYEGRSQRQGRWMTLRGGGLP
jgi:flagellar hook assembly protein FlgD